MASAPQRPDPTDPDAVAAATFSIVRRGWDPDEVRAVLHDVAAVLRAAQADRAGAQAAAPTLTGLDEETLVSMLGEETARVLRTAAEGATTLTARAEEGAARLLREAQDEATRTREDAAEDARATREQAALEANEELEQAKAQGREMVGEARSLRERMLTDLARRRDAAREQLERLDAVRERIATAFAAARQSLDDAMGGVDDSFHVSAEPIDIPSEALVDVPAVGDLAGDRLVITEVVVAEAIVVDGEDDPDGVVVAEVDVIVVPDEVVAELPDDDELDPVDDDVEELDAAVSVVALRDLIVEPVVASFARQLKRVLADEQNAVLDALRRIPRVGALDDLVGSPDEHASAYLGAAAANLVVAVDLGAEGGDIPVDAGAVAAGLAPSVVDEIVAPLRTRLQEGLDRSGGDSIEAASNVRATYREWKTQRLDPLAADLVLAAHGAGAYAALRPGTPICWVLDPASSPCADADDNVLAGVVPAGEPFPTGHSHAPAHVGCRCLLAKADG